MFCVAFHFQTEKKSPGFADVLVVEKYRCGNPVTAGGNGVSWGRYKIVQDSLASLLVTGLETEDPSYDIMTLFIKILNRTDTWGCGREGSI